MSMKLSPSYLSMLGILLTWAAAKSSEAHARYAAGTSSNPLRSSYAMP